MVRLDLAEQAQQASAADESQISAVSTKESTAVISSSEKEIDDSDTIHLFSFPSAEVFSKISEEQFRGMG